MFFTSYVRIKLADIGYFQMEIPLLIYRELKTRRAWLKEIIPSSLATRHDKSYCKIFSDPRLNTVNKKLISAETYQTKVREFLLVTNWKSGFHCPSCRHTKITRVKLAAKKRS